jgi:arylsulfatase A-like enzyme
MSSPRPNILLAIADDLGWPHTGAYGCRFVNTPAFDRVAVEGVLFENAFCPAPQCSPSRAGLLTGLNMWQLEEGSVLWGLLPAKYDCYPDLLEEQGYFVGLTGKGWGPGNVPESGRPHNPAGRSYDARKCQPLTKCMSRNDYAANFADFLADRPDGAPFCFWYGAKEPHRAYEPGSGLRAGKRLEDVDVPGYLPDSEEVRSDLLDYGLEVDRFDQDLGKMMALLEERGELANTIVVVTGDNGCPFPRAKANLYENGLHVPLAIRWGRRVPGGRRVTDFVSFIDLAPTFLDAAGMEQRQPMTGRSLLPILESKGDGRVDPTRDVLFTGRERHAYCRPDNRGYPCRSIKTDDFLYIRNYEPDGWPAGDPDDYRDVDPGPTKTYLLEHGDEEGVREFADAAFAKRPAEELYAAADGDANMGNLADDPQYAEVKRQLSDLLERTLAEQGDPRMSGQGWLYNYYPYYGKMGGEGEWGGPIFPGFREQGKYNEAAKPDAE